MPIDTHTQRHIWRFDGAFDLPKGQPQHGEISMIKQDTPDGWRKLRILAVYQGNFSMRYRCCPQYLLCEDDTVILEGKDRNSGCPFHFAAGAWHLRLTAGDDRHDFTLQECIEMPPLLDALGINDLQILTHL